MSKTLKGIGVALATPLKENYSVDYPALERLIDHVTNGGVDYLVVQGTTGESPVFSWNEKLEILQFILDRNKGKLPVVFGLGGNNTFDMIEKSRDLKGIPIDAILSASPYYNKPSQEGIYRHYSLLADAFPHPIVLYNVPARTASNMEADTTLKLAEHPNIIAMKEASGDLAQCNEIQKGRPEDFTLLSGDDALTLEMIKNGADGVISVVANLVTSDFCEMVRSALDHDFANAETMNTSLQEVYDLAMEEGNPSSIKAGLEAAGICERTVKPPLFDASDDLVKRWKLYLKNQSPKMK
ncbi:MAG: 4-hydroxy-tetrahydrodipicolinate synthase [Ekhidna sp.]